MLIIARIEFPVMIEKIPTYLSKKASDPKDPQRGLFDETGDPAMIPFERWCQRHG